MLNSAIAPRSQIADFRPGNPPRIGLNDAGAYMDACAMICTWALAQPELTPTDLAHALGLHPADVHKLLKPEARPVYSARIIRAVLGLDTQETRVVFRVAADCPPLPKLMTADEPLVFDESGWHLGNAVPGLTLQAVADLADCTDRTTQRYARRGLLPTVELAGRRFVPEADARAWIEWYRAKEGKGIAQEGNHE